MTIQQHVSFSYGRQSYKPEMEPSAVAHDINNILTVVINCIEIAKSHLNDPDNAGNSLDYAVNAAGQAKDLVQQIFTGKNGEANYFKPLEIGPVIASFIEMFRASARKDIAIESHLDVKGKIMTNTAQMNRLLMNLCTNAIQSMPDGGKLIIDIKTVSLDAGIHPMEDYLMISVSDTGKGIPAEKIGKIFDPYFTTKEKGSGLGLVVVDEIVKKHQGFITCKSIEDEGTTFCVYIPLYKGFSPQLIPVNLKESPGSLKKINEGGKEKVLFVDDEKNVLILAKEVLKKNGYNVVVASNGKEALDLFMKEPDGFDILIADVAMPVMNGEELVERVLKIKPGFPIILCTGYCNLVTRGRLRMLGVKKILMKPYLMKELTRDIQEVLGK